MSIDITSPQSIAHHIYTEVPNAEYPEFAEKFGLVNALHTDYVVQASGARFSVGPDIEYADGICWSLYADQADYATRSPFAQGGWSFDDTAAAESELAEIIAAIAKLAQ